MLGAGVHFSAADGALAANVVDEHERRGDEMADLLKERRRESRRAASDAIEKESTCAQDGQS